MTEKQTDWNLCLDSLAMGHNASNISQSRKLSPFRIITGHTMTLPLDAKLLKLKNPKHVDVNSFSEDFLSNLEIVRNIVPIPFINFSRGYHRAVLNG